MQLPKFVPANVSCAHIFCGNLKYSGEDRVHALFIICFTRVIRQIFKIKMQKSSSYSLS